MKVRMKVKIYIILRSWEEKKIGSWLIDFNARFYELNLEKGKETLEMFLVNNLSYRYYTYTKEKDNDSLSIARGLIGSERRWSGPEKEEPEEWVETR